MCWWVALDCGIAWRCGPWRRHRRRVSGSCLTVPCLLKGRSYVGAEVACMAFAGSASTPCRLGPAQVLMPMVAARAIIVAITNASSYQDLKSTFASPALASSPFTLGRLGQVFRYHTVEQVDLENKHWACYPVVSLASCHPCCLRRSTAALPWHPNSTCTSWSIYRSSSFGHPRRPGHSCSPPGR